MIDTKFSYVLAGDFCRDKNLEYCQHVGKYECERERLASINCPWTCGTCDCKDQCFDQGCVELCKRANSFTCESMEEVKDSCKLSCGQCGSGP